MTAGFAVGWRQVVACMVLMGASAMVIATFSVLAVPLGHEFRPTRMVLMLAMTIMSGVAAVIAPFCGSMMDRLSLKLLLAAAGGLLVLGFVALSFASSFPHVLAVYGVLMAPGSIILGPMSATVLLSRWFVKRRGRALGIAIAGIALGNFIYPPLLQALLDSNDWRTALRTFAVVLGAILAVAVAMVVNQPSDRGLHPDGAATEPVSTQTGGPAPAFSTRALLTDPTFWMLAGLIAIILSGLKGIMTNLVPLSVDEGIAPSRAAFLISVFAACGFVAKLGFAAVADKLDPRLLLAASLVGFAAGAAFLVRAEAGYLVIMAGVSLVGFFGAAIPPLQALLVPRIFGQYVVGRVSGLIQSVVGCALLVTPAVFGLIFDLTGNYDLVFFFFVALTLLALVMVPYIRLEGRAASPHHPLAPQPAALRSE